MVRADAGNMTGRIAKKRVGKLGGMRTALVWMALLCLGATVPAFAGRKPEKSVATADGRPIRKVFIRTASPDTAASVSTALAQDTCLTTVSQENQADAVLDVGILLPGIGGGMPMPTVFAPSARTQTLGNSKNGHIHSASTTCTDEKDGGCSNSYNVQGGDLGAELPPGFARTGGAGLDVSLISTGKASQELWEPETRKKQAWTDQLRVAAGCPVCPGEHFNRRRDKTYRDWIQTKCPAVLTAAAQ